MWCKRAISTCLALAMLLNGACAVIEQERTNRGGFLDHVLDRHWMKADSKGMRALRAFAIQVSLARIASVSAKNEPDRQLLAIRIGALTKRFLPVYACAFDTNPLGVPGTENDPCFYYDSAMVDYASGLFDLAMIALPLEDARKLVNIVQTAAINPINVIELLDVLLSLARDALKYGRVIGALYRDTVELEVQIWLATPAIDDRPPSARVSEADVAGLREIYARRNDDLQAWLAAIATLRGAGLEPLAQRKFFAELGGLMKYLCGLITKAADALQNCRAGLPTTIPPAPSVLGSPPRTMVGAAIVPPRVAAAPPRQTPGVVTAPVVTPAPPPVVTPPAAAAPAPVVTPPPRAALPFDQRIRAFWLSDPARKQAVEDWVRANVGIRMVDFLRLAAQEANRQRIINDLKIP
jgi:hypothetical protein